MKNLAKLTGFKLFVRIIDNSVRIYLLHHPVDACTICVILADRRRHYIQCP